MNVIYSNDYYNVVLLDEPIVIGEPGVAPLHYGVYNTQTKVTETYSSYQPGAIQVADECNKRLKEFIGDSDPVAFEPEIVA